MKSYVKFEDYIEKTSLKAECLGTLDELNSSLGMALSFTNDKEIILMIKYVQGELFRIGNCIFNSDKDFIFELDFLDKNINEYYMKVANLKNFIFPNGCRTATSLHLARAICRRAERILCSLNNINKNAVEFLNKLSDFLFILARYVNKKANIKEEIWKE